MLFRKTQQPNSVPSKSLLIFFFSLIMGIVSVVLSQSYINNQIAEHQQAMDVSEQQTTVVVPKHSMKRGDVLMPELLAVRKIPSQYADNNAVNEADYKEAIGRTLAFDLEKGRTLLWAHLDAPASPTFSGQVPDGLRALTVRVDEINAISGFLQPGDQVDLLLSHGYAQHQTIAPLIEQLEVIATGVQTLDDPVGNEHRRHFSTITVQVTPLQAQRITLAQKVGQITAVLRNPDDRSSSPNKTISVAELLGQEPSPKPAVSQKRYSHQQVQPAIEFIVGGS